MGLFDDTRKGTSANSVNEAIEKAKISGVSDLNSHEKWLIQEAAKQAGVTGQNARKVLGIE